MMGVMQISRRSLLAAGLAAPAATALGLPDALAITGARRTGTGIWTTFLPGTHQGTAGGTGLVMKASIGRVTLTDAVEGRRLVCEHALWTSPVTTTSAPLAELVASWNASTPVGAAVRVWLRARTTAGTWSRWFVMGLWGSSSANATSPTRTSVAGQSDAVARVSTDTLAARDKAFNGVQLRLELLRTVGATARPVVQQATVTGSTRPLADTPVSPVGVGRGKVLDVPAYSQMLHEGHYPHWNGGGEAWCSATSTAMVLDYWKKGASAAETSWVRPTPHVNPQVEQVVRGVWDAGYRGTGNWPFNVAYASARGLRGRVERLRSLADAEKFIAAGIPLIVSTAFTRTQLTGAGFGTVGHLMVLRGFDARGNVVVNDPASGLKASNALVRRTYDRAQFESAWGRSGGTTYVIHPAGRAVPGNTDVVFR